MLYADECRLHLFRLDMSNECVIALNEDFTDCDTDALCEMLTYGGVSVEGAKLDAEHFAEWWNKNDIIAMLELDDDWGLHTMLRPFADVGVFAEITGLRWEVG